MQTPDSQSSSPSILNESSSWFMDVIRGVSSQLVLFGHGISFVRIMPYLLPPYIPFLQNIAVVCFFFMSGFLISSSVFRKRKQGNYGFGEYWIERFSRIYSAFIPCLLFTLVVDLISIQLAPDLYSYYPAFDLKTFVGNLFMFQDFPYFFNKLTSFGSNRPLWTLGIEWWLYMAFGFAFLFHAKNWKIICFKILILIPLLIVPIHSLQGRGKGLTLVWVWGALGSLLFKKILTNKYTNIKTALFIALVATGLSISKLMRTKIAYGPKIGFYISLSLLAWLVVLHLWDFKLPVKVKKTTTFIASYSFTLYLIHYPLMDSFRVALANELSATNIFILSFIVCNLIAWVMASFTELKYKMISNFFKTRFLRLQRVN